MITLYILLIIENTTEMSHLRIVGGFLIIRYKDEDRFTERWKLFILGYEFVGQRHTSAGLGGGYETSLV